MLESIGKHCGRIVVTNIGNFIILLSVVKPGVVLSSLHIPVLRVAQILTQLRIADIEGVGRFLVTSTWEGKKTV